MPKGNTHLFLANKVARNVKVEDIKNIIWSNLDHYYLGSIAPDAFAYLAETVAISDYLHGADGNPTNE